MDHDPTALQRARTAEKAPVPHQNHVERLLPQRLRSGLNRLFDSAIDDNKCRADEIGMNGAPISSNPEYIG